MVLLIAWKTCDIARRHRSAPASMFARIGFFGFWAQSGNVVSEGAAMQPAPAKVAVVEGLENSDHAVDDQRSVNRLF